MMGIPRCLMMQTIMRPARRVIGISLFLLAGAYAAYPVDVTIHQSTSGGSEGTPFWLQANRWGLNSDSSLQTNLGAEVTWERDFGDVWGIELLADGDVFADDDGVIPRLRFAYAALSWRALELKGGMYPELVGLLPAPELSSGSMIVSGNARPLPSVQLSMPEWTAVPMTNEKLEIRGGLLHGWFLGDRVQDGALLHEKWGYARLGNPEETRLYLGLVHNTMWGGEIQPVNWDNYLRAFLGREAGDTSTQLGPAGNGLGMWDLGVEMPLDRVDLRGYYHHYFELEHGIYFKNAMDGLWGVAIEIDDAGRWPDTVVMESLYTVYQGGRYHRLTQVLTDAGFDPADRTATFGIGGGAHQYYNHGIYRNGWTHLDRIVGNPLLVAVGEGEELRIASNRVNAYHLGFSGNATENIRYTGKITFATHKPTQIGARYYAPISLVPEGETWVQVNAFLGVEISEAFGNDRLGANIGLAGDWGDIYENTVGFELALRYALGASAAVE